MSSSGEYLQKFVASYIECALWSSVDAQECPLDVNYGLDELAPETRKEMEKDCEDFIVASGVEKSEWWTPDQAGHDFWLTRNGHGAGFWDRGQGEEGQRLTKVAKTFGGSYLYVEDGYLYVEAA